MRRTTTTIFSNYKKDLILRANSGIEEIVQSIQQGHYSLFVENLRATADTDQYETYKALVPAFELESLSGLVYAETPETNLEFLKTIPCLHSAWVKPSGVGYGLLFQIEDCSPNQVNHALKELEQDHDIRFINPKQTIVLFSSDPEAWENDNVKPFWYYPEFSAAIQEPEETNQPALLQEPEAINEPQVIQLSPTTEKHAQEPKKKSSRYEYVNAQGLKQVHAKAVDFQGKDYVIYDEPQQVVEMYHCKKVPAKKHKNLALQMAAKRIVISAVKSGKKGTSKFTGAPKVIVLKKQLIEMQEGREDEITFMKFLMIDCKKGFIDPSTGEETLTEEDLRTIFFEQLEKFKQGKLTVQTTIRKGKINPDVPREERARVAGKLGAEVAKQKNNNIGLVTEAINQLEAEGKTVTKKQIMAFTGLSESTVKRYLRELKKEERKLKKAA